MTDAKLYRKMKALNTITDDFHQRKKQLFDGQLKQVDSFNLNVSYSLLVEEFIRKIAGSKRYKFVLTSSGSFSRRELSPFSDIDLIFIANSIEENESDIANLVKTLWDSGIEVSHTIRDFSDIEKYLQTDLHTFTQFFETRYLLGSNKIYNKWNNELISSLTDEVKIKLLNALIEDINLRYESSALLVVFTRLKWMQKLAQVSGVLVVIYFVVQSLARVF